jgi:acyl-CoA thioester hydrolase
MKQEQSKTILKFFFTVNEQHLDVFGHVNNATYLELFELARWEMITEKGYGLDRIRKTGLGPVILEANIRFKKELLLREKATIETHFHSYGKKIGVITQIMKNHNNEQCCTAEFKFGLFDLDQRKLVSPTQEWLDALGIKSN